MAWATPKTDWSTDDAVGTTDLNRIEENISVLKGIVDLLFPFLHQLKGTLTFGSYTVTFDNHETVGGNYYEVPGVGNEIRYISVNSITPGTIITLSGRFTLAYMSGSVPEFTAAVYNHTGGTLTIGGASVGFVQLVYDGTSWSVVGSY